MLVRTIILLLCCLSVDAATWYAASNGSGTNGTLANPWSVTYAVGEEENSQLQPGDTILFKPGTFVCTNYYAGYAETNQLNFAKSGSVGSPITYKSQFLWQFKFAGGITVPYGTSNLVIHGFYIYDPAVTNRNRTVDYSFPKVEQYGKDVQWLHNCIQNLGGSAFGSWSQSHGKTIQGNIISLCGCYDYTHISGTSGPTWEGAPRGAGMYLEGDGFQALIQGNISFHNLTEGALFTQNTTNFVVTNNIVCNNRRYGLFFEHRDYAPRPITFADNYVFEYTDNIGVSFGYSAGDAGSVDATGILRGNYIVGGQKALYCAGKWKDLTVTNNTIVRLGTTANFLTEVNNFELETADPGNSPTYTIANNSYFSTNVWANSFNYWGSVVDWATWQTSTGDSGSTYTTHLPTTLEKFVLRPSSDASFVHVAVFNWSGETSTTVDLSTYFHNGDRLSIYDVQNVPTSYRSFVFDGSTPVTLALNLTDKAAMLGSFSSFAWDGFDSRFRAFVIHKDPATALASATTLHVGTLR